MAKKNFNISSTLNKNQTPKLAEKVPLIKKDKDIEEVKERVEKIHQPNDQQAESKPNTPVRSKAKSSTDSKKKLPEKLVRMTIDTPESMHKALKIKSIQKGISLRDYILLLIKKELK